MFGLTDLKLYSLNITAFTLSLTDIGDILRIILLVSAITYTVYKYKKAKDD